MQFKQLLTYFVYDVSQDSSNLDRALHYMYYHLQIKKQTQTKQLRFVDLLYLD